jgi:preprotein translocase subunit SecA
VTLASIDRAWQDHLALCADLREGIHLVRLGGQDPLTVFTSEAIQAFSRIDDAIEEAVVAALARVRTVGSRVDLTSTGIRAPSATWTYLVHDDPFENRIGVMLTGPGGITIAIYSAAILMPLLFLWGLVENLVRRGPGRRSDPFGR